MDQPARRAHVRRPALVAGVLVCASAVTLSACQQSEPSGNVSGGPARGGAVAVETVASRFDPGTIQLTANEEATIEITNEDETAHDFAIDSLDLNTGTIEPGSSATATITVPEGTTEFHCTFHSNMTGTIEGT